MPPIIRSGGIKMHGRMGNIAMCDYQESVTTGQTDTQTPDKVIPMCRYALKVTQKGYRISGYFRIRIFVQKKA